MHTSSLIWGTVALLCLAGLVRVTGHIRDLAAPPAYAVVGSSDTLEHILCGGGFLIVGRPRRAGDDVTVQSGPSQAAQLQTAREVQEYLGDRLRPDPGRRVLIQRPDRSEIVTCTPGEGRWQLLEGDPPLSHSDRDDTGDRPSLADKTGGGNG